ncbi:Arginine--tRNA ligase [Scenedesmus sp. PABB004]|nr:Arginine--tRNA ligase [Scenedesmus sp. PABB004]
MFVQLRGSQQIRIGRAAASAPGLASCAAARRTSSAARRAAAAAAAPKAPPPYVDMAAPGQAVSLRGELAGLFRTALGAAFPAAGEEEPVIAPCAQSKFGDYQCNNAMGLFGRLKGTEGAPKAPRDVATAVVAALPANELLTETSLAGPGFINCKLSSAALAARVNRLLREGVGALAPRLRYGRIVVDFSSPNVAKEMHVGHLRSTIIGDTIANTLEFCGADVVRLNHIGDWGTQFGMLIEHMAELRPGGLAESRDEDVADLQVLYRAAKKRFDEDDDFKGRAREAVTRLQSGDAACIAAWQRICAASRREFEAIYTRLGVSLSERGESFYNPMLKDVVDELQSLGVAEQSEGATCVFVEGQEVPLIVQKSDGGYGYASTDMAAIKQRVQDEKADWVIYVTDAGQATHFDMIFAAARRAGWLPPKGSLEAPRVSHVGFGLVLGEDGKKFKTRSGDVVRLVELLDEAKARCKESVRSRRLEAGEAVDEAELEATANAMGYGAVKYADLKNSRTTNYKFSYDAMLELKGNTAVYLLYAHARIAGIVRKAAAAGADVDALLAGGAGVELGHARERELALAIAKFPEAIEDMLEELMPNRLTDYLYFLSEAFTAFYTDCKVLGSDQEASRLLLVEATARTMRQCFKLLGITPLYRI